MDEYETRGWVGWHHTARSVLALWFLGPQKHRLGGKQPLMSVPEVRARLLHLIDTRRGDEDQILEWSRWRHERNRIAKACHR